MKKLKGVCIGTGYFSHFQFDAWMRIPEVEITAVCDINEMKGKEIQEKYGVNSLYTNYREMIIKENPDFVDIITPPDTHLELCEFAADNGVNIICQKPLAPSYDEAIRLVEYVKSKGVRFIVHENFRFQPWHSEIKKLLSQGTIGDLFSLNFRSRMGDGWGKDAYLSRQPYFRGYDHFLIYETGVHFIDTFRYHAGEVKNVYALLRKLNPVNKGEDCGWVILEFENNINAMLDANRYNESNTSNPRYTFGEYLLEGSEGAIRLYYDGSITIQNLGKSEKEHSYKHNNIGFAGDCCYIFQQHFIDCIQSGQEFETNPNDYLKTLAVQEAVYQSAKFCMPVKPVYKVFTSSYL